MGQIVQKFRRFQGQNMYQGDLKNHRRMPGGIFMRDSEHVTLPSCSLLFHIVPIHGVLISISS